jgi:MFS family permease
VETLAILWNDKMTLLFLLIVSGFWLMFMQLWDLLPNFLDEWVDRRSVGNWLSQFSIFKSFLESDNSLKPEMIINIDSAAIICLVLPLSALFARFRMMTALILGMVISVIGFVMTGMFTSGLMACIAVFIFAIGEIICSPKFDEYIGMTAPEDKKAIYMGFVNIPFAIGWALGNFLSGPLYETFSSKPMLAKKYLIEQGVDPTSLNEITADELMQKLQTVTNTSDAFEATHVLWETYTPWIVWIILGSIGFASMVGMIVFYYKSGMAAKDKLEQAQKAKSPESVPA